MIHNIFCWSILTSTEYKGSHKKSSSLNGRVIKAWFNGKGGVGGFKKGVRFNFLLYMYFLCLKRYWYKNIKRINTQIILKYFSIVYISVLFKYSKIVFFDHNDPTRLPT